MLVGNSVGLAPTKPCLLARPHVWNTRVTTVEGRKMPVRTLPKVCLMLKELCLTVQELYTKYFCTIFSHRYFDRLG